MVESLFSLLWQLPVGLLLAALLLEVFILQNDRRELEPAVLWLLCCTAISGALAGVAHYLTQGTNLSYAGPAIVASLLASLGFWFKRQARNKGVLKLTDRFYRGDSYVPVKAPNQAFYIFGFRTMIFGAFIAALAAYSLGKSTTPKGKLGAAGQMAQNGPAPAPGVAPAPAAIAPAGTVPAPAALAPAPGTAPAADPAVAAAPVPGAVPGAAPAVPVAPGAAPGAVPAAAPAPAGDPAMVAAAAPAVPGAAPATVPAVPGAAPVPAPAVPGAAPMPAPAMPGAAPAPAVAVVAAAASETRPVSKNSIFASKVRPIIQRHCVTCHGAEKQKGDVRLDSPDFIRAGAAGKAVILGGKPLQSSFYTLIVKPLGDEDRMPPKGDGVSKADADMIKKWIESGADMGDGVSTASSGGVQFKSDQISGALQPPPAALLEELKKNEVNIRPESKDGKLLNLIFSYSLYGEGKLQALLPTLGSMANNIYALDLSRTVVHDADLAHVGAMANLHSLNLGRTDIGDTGLSHLSNLSHLEVLNIYSTKVTDAGLEKLSGLKSLKNLYVFQTMATEAGTKKLQASISGVKIDLGK